MADDDGKKEKKFAESKLKMLSVTFSNLEQKLDKLLESYLEEIVDAESYQRKKDELLQTKKLLQEKIEEIKTKGSSWLEPFENFIQRAFQARKIASSKNNPEELCSFGKSACSNFNLLNRQISFTPNLGWDTVFSFASCLRSASPSTLNSYAVLGLGFESFDKLRTLA